MGGDDEATTGPVSRETGEANSAQTGETELQ